MTTPPAVDAQPFDTVDAGFVTEFGARWLKAQNAHDLAGILACCTEDIRWEDPALDEPGWGHARVSEFLTLTWRAFPNVRFTEPEPPLISLDGTQVVAHWHATGTMLGPLEPPGLAPTRDSVEFGGVDIWRFRGGRLAYYRAIYDTVALARDLGAVPARGSLAERVMVALHRARVSVRARQR